MTHVNPFLLRCIQRCLLVMLVSFSCLHTTQPPKSQVAFSATNIDEDTLALTLTIAVPSNAYLYRDYINVSVDNPNVTLSELTNQQESRSVYDPTFKTTKKVFDHDVTISMQAHSNKKLSAPARLHISYYLSSNKGITQESFPLLFLEKPNTEQSTEQTVEQVRKESASVAQAPVAAPALYDHQTNLPAVSRSYSEHLSLLITQTNTLWIRLLLVLLLGVLMSLTPCIYPMIPITVGILQAQGSKSLLRNLLVSLAYTTGIATTFALLGLAAATTGQMFGAFMANPFVILFIVLLLAYLGFAMFGFYEMYVPSFLKSRSTQSGNGSLTSAFLFGVASGSVASPCLSPGLVLLLSIVTTLKSKLMGFVMLFMFGVGLSLPLLVIGTFSSSLSLLPRAGMWMIEVKKFFGFMLLGMCFYFLQPIIPAPYLLSMVALFLFAAGSCYLYSESKKTAGIWHSLSGLFAIILIAGSLVTATQAYKAYLMTQECVVDCSHWQMNYAQALLRAQACNKKLFIDVGASFCSICTAIDKKVLSNKLIEKALSPFCCVKINGADDPDNVIKLLQEKYGVVGFPTFLLLDPHTGALIKRWGSELYNVDIQAFAQELEELAKA